jgi:hypothetical protein
MDPTPEEITALADQLSQLAKSAAASTDPKEKKHQTQALVLQAKKMIAQIQDPFDAIMDHVVNVRISTKSSPGYQSPLKPHRHTQSPQPSR